MDNGKSGKVKGLIKHFFTFIRVHIYQILYLIVLAILWVYIGNNWDKCVSMKFFEQFDGNNILFLCGIVWIILFFYDVEAKDFKFKRKKTDALNRDIQSVTANFQHDRLNSSSAQTSNTQNEGGNSNE